MAGRAVESAASRPLICDCHAHIIRGIMRLTRICSLLKSFNRSEVIFVVECAENEFGAGGIVLTAAVSSGAFLER